ncbi:hypothetical protein B4N89_37025 [Embleya scabrispora]|uniref:Uncharacterized protein n=1 Tax=Embleya scabrispora TaxID=159449 RepID=A0A1T3NLV4_9ACTN|nr:hypothetical protein B4N89_37025 [Embleya scabrispora]
MDEPERRTTVTRRRQAQEDRRRRRTVFLRELVEARALRERVRPRHTRNERLRQMMRARTFRY